MSLHYYIAFCCVCDGGIYVDDLLLKENIFLTNTGFYICWHMYICIWYEIIQKFLSWAEWINWSISSFLLHAYMHVYMYILHTPCNISTFPQKLILAVKYRNSVNTSSSQYRNTVKVKLRSRSTHHWHSRRMSVARGEVCKNCFRLDFDDDDDISKRYESSNDSRGNNIWYLYFIIGLVFSFYLSTLLREYSRTFIIIAVCSLTKHTLSMLLLFLG